MKRSLIVIASLIFSLGLGIFFSPARAARAKIPEKIGTPYLGAIVVNPDTGEIVFEENADASFYPASIVKLMMLLIIQEKIDEGALRLSDPVHVTADAARMGGSQVYLAENEVFPIEDLLYALIVQSANDAAVALAIHAAGSKEAFVEMMQQRADGLSMEDTEFHTVHGLPPAPGQKPDISSPRDLAKLARELLKHPDALRYTSTRVRGFRDGKFEMRSHNRLLDTFDGCDGLKTGYFRAGGFSIVASAFRNGKRLFTVVAGSKTKEDRNNKACELLSRAFSKLSSKRDEAVSIPFPQIQPEEKRPELEPASKIPLSSGEKIAHDPGHPPQKEGSAKPAKIILLVILFVAVAGLFFWLGRLSTKGVLPTSRILFK